MLETTRQPGRLSSFAWARRWRDVTPWRSLAVEQDALAFDAPSVAGECSILANDTMAGNGDGEIVLRASFCHGTDGLWCADASRDLGIGYRRASRDLTKCLPHPLLKCGATNIKWEIQTDPWRFNEPNHPRHQRFVVAIAADEVGPWETVLEVSRQLVGIITEEDCCNPLLARADQNSAEAALANRERTEDLLAQGQSLRRGMSRIEAFFIRWRSPVPPLIMRLEAMVEWAGQPNNVTLGKMEGLRELQIEASKLKE